MTFDPAALRQAVAQQLGQEHADKLFLPEPVDDAAIASALAPLFPEGALAIALQSVVINVPGERATLTPEEAEKHPLLFALPLPADLGEAFAAPIVAGARLFGASAFGPRFGTIYCMRLRPGVFQGVAAWFFGPSSEIQATFRYGPEETPSGLRAAVSIEGVDLVQIGREARRLNNGGATPTPSSGIAAAAPADKTLLN
jgi:hypothetical protein